MAASLGDRLCGVTCVWAVPCYPAFEEQVFAIQQHYIEPIGEIPDGQDLKLVLAQSVIADKMEVLTILSRMVGIVRPKSITICAIVTDSKVKAQLQEFLSGYFSDDKISFIATEYPRSLEKPRHEVAGNLMTVGSSSFR